MRDKDCITIGRSRIHVSMHRGASATSSCPSPLYLSLSLLLPTRRHCDRILVRVVVVLLHANRNRFCDFSLARLTTRPQRKLANCNYFLYTLGVQSPNLFIHLLAIDRIVTTDENTIREVRSNAQIECIYINLLNVRMPQCDYCPRRRPLHSHI